MPYDDGVAQRVREALIDQSGVVEKRMFGGLAFMVRGHMCCGIVGAKLMVRVGPEAYEDALAQPHANEMDFTGKPMKGFIYVTAEGIEDDDDLQSWVDRGLRFVTSLPSK